MPDRYFNFPLYLVFTEKMLQIKYVCIIILNCRKMSAVLLDAL